MTRQPQRSHDQILHDLNEWWRRLRDIAPRLTKRHALDAAKQIARYDPRHSQREAIAKRKEARLRIYEAHALLLTSQFPDLDPAVSDLINALTRARDDIDAITLRLPPSGGQAITWKRKFYTAGGCYCMIKRYGNAEPTTRIWFRNYIWFSETFFAIATGDREDMSTACRKWKKQQDRMLEIARRAGVTATVLIREWPQ
jgi:hypothetical protein